jgi:hypothetical protein
VDTGARRGENAVIFLPGLSAVPVPLAPREAPAIGDGRLRWAWPVAILLGFPLGGLLANVIAGRIDSVGAAIAGGLIAGAVIGTAQWLALRPRVEWLWIAATSAGMAVGLTVGAAIVDYGISRGDLALMGAVTGAGVGALQAVVLARRVPGAVWWALANPPAWAVAWLVTSWVISTNVKDQYANFGAGGALVFALLTWCVLTFLLSRTERDAHVA